MSHLALDRLDDVHLEARLVDLAARDRATTAELLAHLAEADARHLHLTRGFESLHAYCVEHLRFSDAAAHKRIAVARVAREHPGILARIADGGLSLSTVLVLRPWLNGSHAEDLLEACTGRSRAAIEALLAERFPRSESFEWGTQASVTDDAPACKSPCQLAPGRADASLGAEAVLNKVESASTPLTGARVVLQVTVARETQAKLQRARELLGRAVEPGDVAEVLDRALDALIVSLEKRRHGLHVRPRATSLRPVTRSRHVPAAMRREVHTRDEGRCAFTSEDGRRCTSRHALEYDHVQPLALGGTTTMDNLRLLCPAHNQHEAERRFGVSFMASRRARREAGAVPRPPRPMFPHEDDVRGALRTLGFRPAEIGIGVVASATLSSEADLASRMRAALAALRRS